MNSYFLDMFHPELGESYSDKPHLSPCRDGADFMGRVSFWELPDNFSRDFFKEVFNASFVKSEKLWLVKRQLPYKEWMLFQLASHYRVWVES